MREQVILRVVTKLMIPFLMVFGLYVITHGELGPGGGFQGGVIIAAAFILYGIVYGPGELDRLFPKKLIDTLSCLGLLLYAGVGMFCLFSGYNFLEYTPLKPSNPGLSESWGMTLVEYGVGITVSTIMITIFKEMVQGPVPMAKGTQTRRVKK